MSRRPQVLQAISQVSDIIKVQALAENRKSEGTSKEASGKGGLGKGGREPGHRRPCRWKPLDLPGKNITLMALGPRSIIVMCSAAAPGGANIKTRTAEGGAST